MKPDESLIVGEYFAADGAGPVPETADSKTGTIDVVWYSGAAVPRIDPDTGEPYMLTLDMAGCRLERLNNGAPVFDTHFTGDDFKSMIAGQVGTRAQRGVVRKAWAEGPAGKATLQFDLGDPDGAEMFRKASAGILQNLSFGTWVYRREKVAAQAGIEGAASGEIAAFTATDWEPFEVSPCTVPADFNTCFLSAESRGASTRASGPKENPAMETIVQDAGLQARTNDAALATARAEAEKLERERVSGIMLAVSQGRTRGWAIGDEFARTLVSDGISASDARGRLWDEFVVKSSQQDAHGKDHVVHEQASVTRDQRDTRRQQMEASLLLRYDPKAYSKLAEQGQEFRGMSLIELARECLQFSGITVRGMAPMDIAGAALRGRVVKVDSGLPTEHFQAEYFADGPGSQTTSDFPAILANVLNKTLRQSYEAYPQTFKPFCRQATAKDFKPVQRTMLHDVAALPSLDEKGEYHRAQLSDSKISYGLATFGEIVALTRKVIVNDDLQAFTRVPAMLGVAAAQLESNTVWAVITGASAGIYPGDTTSTNLFHANHSNLLTGAGSALALAGLAAARTAMRLMTGPNGTKLNLTPSYILVPAALENSALQLIYPMNLAVTAVTAGVPEWIRSLTPIVEPRLDASSSAYWYLVADPAQIDTLEYCYLEGQQGVYLETRQGFEVDGIEVKARMDFAAAAIEYRGLQKNAGS